MLWWLSLLLLLWEVHSTVMAFFPRAPKLKLGLITSTWLNLINSKIFTIIHHPYCCYIYIYIYTLYNMFAHSSRTHLLILLFIMSPVYCIAHFIYYTYSSLFYFFLYSCIFSCIVLQYFALSIKRTWPDLHFTTDYILYNWVCDE